MSFNVVIPARLNSSRLEEKVLIELNGIPMVIHVAKRASLSGAKNVVIATDDKKIVDIAQYYNYKSVMTDKNHRSGTDRCLEASEINEWDDQEIIVNVQADEPLIEPELIDLLAKNIMDGGTGYVTACSEFRTYKEFINPNNVKVVLDIYSNALYFSRSAIPFSISSDLSVNNYAFHHLGIYAYRLNTLRKFCGFSISDLEKIERLEQLRALSNNLKLRVINYDGDSVKGVDTLEDLDFVRKIMSKQ